ncbi:MAG: lipoyltransferase [Muribaculaceae bacterium]|nr:lipoyltransferase [Muribaculaceae bacterium]
MKHPALPDENIHRRLPFYLAMEEWVARRLPPDDYFFAWRVKPTVICGRNQDMAAEVDLDYCRAEGIDVVRRRSGGGCVYADMNNWMFSFITASNEVGSTFSRYTSLIAEMLGTLGFDARATGRNDIFIGDRKVSGNAFYHLPGRAIVHGTMLCDIDTERMSRAITPSRSKLAAKGVRSVSSRITSLRAEGLDMSVADFGRYAVSHICTGGDIALTPGEIEQIEMIESGYYDPVFLRSTSLDVERPNRTAAKRRRRHTRIEGVGEFDAEVEVDSKGLISAVSLAGDFFVTGDVESALCRHLHGVEYTPAAIATAVIDPSGVIPGLSAQNLADILFVEEEP